VISPNPFEPRQLGVITINKAKVGTYAMQFTNTITYGGQTWTPNFTFNINIVDPCSSTTINTFTIPTILVVNGERATHTFDDATDTIELESGVDTLCGLRTYAITFSSNGASIDWVTIAPQSPLQTKWDIVAAPVLDSVVGNSNL